MPTTDRTPTPWDRKLWGIEFRSKGERTLIGSLGITPTRPLLFVTWRAARNWCDNENKRYAKNPSTAHWRVRPVRVREIVRVV